MTLVSLRDVSVAFPRRGTGVLHGIALEIAPGERMLVIGGSGSGKSTLLQLVTGVIPHSVTAQVEGTVTVSGVDTRTTSVVDLSRTVAVLAQDPASGICLPTVEEEIALPLENRGVDPAAISGLIDAALCSAGVAHLRTRRTTRLSGGEGQRVALAAALAAGPALLLLDEPTSMLDSEGVAAVRDAIASSVARYAPAVVLVEHRLDEFAGHAGLAALPERTIVLGAAGTLAADGPTREVLADHARMLTAAGCWLPIGNELDAVFGTVGGLESPAVRAGLTSLARRSTADEAADDPGPGRGTTLLAATALSVSRTRRPRRSRAPYTPVLSGVDLDLHAGQVVALLGANGSGKSTLLLTLAGLLPAAAGAVTGERPGMVFQNPEHQFVAHTVSDEVGYGLPPGSGSLVARLLDSHGLAHLADQSPHRLSGGEKRRVSLAAMLAHGRGTLLADEPTFGLDRRATISVITALRGAARDGAAVLFSSHDLRTVATLADRAVVVADGRMIANGPVFEVLRDAAVLESAHLGLPPLVRWLLENAGSDAGVLRALRALDAEVPVDAVAAS